MTPEFRNDGGEGIVSAEVEHPFSQAGFDSPALRARFGDLRIVELHHSNSKRLIHVVGAKGLSITCALLHFADFAADAPLADIRAQLRNTDKFLRDIFTEAGYEMRKNILVVDLVTVPAWLQKAFGYGGDEAKLRCSELIVRKGAEPPQLFATIIEVYSPEFRPDVITGTSDRLHICLPSAELATRGVELTKLWDALGELKPGKRPGYILAGNGDSRSECLFPMNRMIREFLYTPIPSTEVDLTNCRFKATPTQPAIK